MAYGNDLTGYFNTDINTDTVPSGRTVLPGWAWGLGLSHFILISECTGLFVPRGRDSTENALGSDVRRTVSLGILGPSGTVVLWYVVQYRQTVATVDTGYVR